MIWGRAERFINIWRLSINLTENCCPLNLSFLKKNDMKKFMSCWENSIELNHRFSGKPLLLTKVNSSQIENFLWMEED